MTRAVQGNDRRHLGRCNFVRLRAAARFALIAVPVLFACSVSKVGEHDAPTADAAPTADVQPGSESATTLLGGVTAIVIPNCAVSGCHDAQTKEHGMDLSSAANIYDAWVNRKGLDHCRNALRLRVVPGAPDESYVMVKILGTETCDLSQRMPAPPRAQLTDDQIQVIRAWIASGAPAGRHDGGIADVAVAQDDAVASDTGPDTTDARPAIDTSPCSEAGAFTPLRRSGPSSLNQVSCSPTQPCPAGMSCMGMGCDDVWECFAHAASPGEHPCPTDSAAYCGCDGVTFMALRTCPDRPYEREGACEDGVNCDPSALNCGGIEPMCPQGQVPSVVDGRYGACVAANLCVCESDAQCPHRDKFTCDTIKSRCEMLPVGP